MDQQALFTNMVTAVLAQLLPHLTSISAEVAKLSARYDVLHAGLEEERAARLKTIPFPMLPLQQWTQPAPSLNAYMSDSQPSAQVDQQQCQASPAAPPIPCAPAPLVPSLPQPHQQITVGLNNGSLSWNSALPLPTSSALPFSPPAAHPYTALQHAGLPSAQQQAPPPHYQQ